MRHILLFITVLLLAPVAARAQAPADKDLKALFEMAQSRGIETALRGDISDRLGFGDHPLPIKDLVITKDGVQHAVNAFIVGDKGYLLFNSHLRLPQVYLFVKDVQGTLHAGVRGMRFQPITEAVDMKPGDDEMVISAEESFWRQWIADGAQLPAQ